MAGGGLVLTCNTKNELRMGDDDDDNEGTEVAENKNKTTKTANWIERRITIRKTCM